MKPENTKILYMGTPDFAVAPLKLLYESGFNIVGVVTAPDKPAGRGMQILSSSVKKYSEINNLPIYQPVSLKDPQFVTSIQNINPDIIVVVAFRMLPKVIWSIPRLGTFNLHASLLPKYRGAAPINWAIINGETQTGVTTFMIDEEIDTGSIMFSEKCPIEPIDNFGTLHDKLMKSGSELVLKTVQALSTGDVNLTLQSSVEATMGDVPAAPKLNKENTKIDWSKSSEQISNQVRGLSPYPTAHTLLVNKLTKENIPVKIFEAISENESNESIEGTIFSDYKKYLKVQCHSGLLSIQSLQLSGKKRLTTKEFLAGFRDLDNFIFM